MYLIVNDNPQSTLFNISGNQGDQWIKAQADFSSTSPSFLLFVGVRGSNYDGDIALDDISVDSGSCASLNAATTTTAVPMTTAG